MRKFLAALGVCLAAGPVSAATLDIGALGLRTGSSLLDTAASFEAVDFGDGTIFASVRGLARDIESTIDYAGAADFSGPVMLQLSRPAYTVNMPALEAGAIHRVVDQSGAAFLFRVDGESPYFADLSSGDYIYATISGDFSDYAGGDYAGPARLELWNVAADVAPIPLPAGIMLLPAALGMLTLLRRRRRV